jgi:hypothetical protein
LKRTRLHEERKEKRKRIQRSGQIVFGVIEKLRLECPAGIRPIRAAAAVHRTRGRAQKYDPHFFLFFQTSVSSWRKK